jgi:hypothetical protein
MTPERRSEEPVWLNELREAARGGARGADVEVLPGARPRWFDADTGRALSGGLLAAFVVAAAIFRARLSGGPGFDLIGLTLRVAGAAFLLRACLSVALLIRRGVRESEARAATLVLGPEGLWLGVGGAEHWVAKSDVIGLALPEPVEQGSTPAAQAPLDVVLKSATGAPRTLAIPPYFAANQDILLARMNRWLGHALAEPATRFDPPLPDPEGRYRRIAQGSSEAGELRIPEGFGYLSRAPYGVLLGCLFAFDALGNAGPLHARLLPGVLAACALALAFLAGWFVWMNGRRKSRLGIAMALTRQELLLRGKAGVIGIPWGQLAQIEVDARLTWSPFFGSYPVRVLVLNTTDGDRMLFDGGFLGVPADVVRVLCEAYRRRAI